METEEYLIIAGTLFVVLAAVIWWLADLNFAKKRIVENQKKIISHQVADMKQMISELEGWEKCLQMICENRKKEALAVLEEKIALAEAQRRHWETLRLKELKNKLIGCE